MYLTQLTLKNWGPYYGEQTVELLDTVYAVQAAHHQDADRSNWLGKSWFIGAIRFLLTGVTPSSCPNEDGWISWGEKEGMVHGLLSDGTMITRSRSRGKSTQLVLMVQGKDEARQDRAQQELTSLVGMDDNDLVATSFIEQRAIARLVLEDPAPRAKIVNGWLKLDPLQKAEDWLRDQLNEHLKDMRQYGSEPTQTLEQINELLDACELAHERAVATLNTCQEGRKEKLAKLQELSTHRLHNGRALRFPEVQAAGKRAKAQLDKLARLPKNELQTLEENTERWLEHKSRTADRQYQLRELVQGEWDGTCPKTCEACPVKDQVQAAGASMEVELNQLEAQLDQEAASLDSAKEKLQAHRAKVQEKERLESEIVRLREEGTALLASVDYIEEYGVPADGDKLEAESKVADELYQNAVRAEAEVANNMAIMQRAHKQVQAGAGERERLQASIRTTQEALAVVGRQGAQREVAESALAKIELGANQLLQAAGIDLQVKVSWAREGKGLATHCDACGAAFPKSQTAKVCAVCGAARGPKVVEKLTLEPNDRSGAADDIAGLAFQLSASAWLRRERMAAWSVACIDEPFGQLDRANARALSAHLHAMIRGSFAFRQGFIVAHDQSIMEALPARVQIKGSEQGSTLEVG